MPARRNGRSRDRRGRGPRGPLVLPGPLTPGGCPRSPSRAEQFDDVVLSAVERIEAGLGDQLRDVEFGVEDVPPVAQPVAGAQQWLGEPVPLAAQLPASAGDPARIVLFRLPIELRATTRAALTALVAEVLVEHVATLLGREPGEINPDSPAS